MIRTDSGNRQAAASPEHRERGFFVFDKPLQHIARTRAHDPGVRLGLFHEAGHILYDGKKGRHIDGENSNPSETTANQFATDILIPPDRQPEIRHIKSRDDVRRMADSLNIAPGIVVGQYEHQTENYGWFAELKKTFHWREE